MDGNAEHLTTGGVRHHIPRPLGGTFDNGLRPKSSKRGPTLSHDAFEQSLGRNRSQPITVRGRRDSFTFNAFVRVSSAGEGVPGSGNTRRRRTGRSQRWSGSRGPLVASTAARAVRQTLVSQHCATKAFGTHATLEARVGCDQVALVSIQARSLSLVAAKPRSRHPG